MSDQHHPQIVNADHVSASELAHGQRFYLKRKQLGSAAGAQKLGCTLVELPPGKRSWPFHYHAANEEAIYVLEGRGRVRIGDSETPVRAGDYVALLAGPGGAHQTFNDSDAVLRYLCFSTMIEPDVNFYPSPARLASLPARRRVATGRSVSSKVSYLPQLAWIIGMGKARTEDPAKVGGYLVLGEPWPSGWIPIDCTAKEILCRLSTLLSLTCQQKNFEIFLLPRLWLNAAQ